MRPDMAKVIVERPRFGSRGRGKPKGYRKQVQKLTLEGLPRAEGMRRRWTSGRKMFNEHLGPLRRYLDSQVGRPRSKVFSEICANIRRDSVVQDHLRDHVEQYVETNVILIGGVPCHKGGHAHGKPLGRWYREYWYVCPRSGLLKRVKKVARRRPPPPGGPSANRYVRVRESLQCRLIDGAWHLVELRPLPPAGTQTLQRDVLFGRRADRLDLADARAAYGAAVYAVSVRRLCRRELRHYPIPVDEWT